MRGMGPRPGWTAAVVVGVAAVLGVLAAVFPARRASRLDPLAGLQYE